MTGLKLHCPPGFVDRAYLVFLVSDTTHRTADTRLEDLSRSHPFLVVGERTWIVSRGTSPGRPWRPYVSRELELLRGVARAASGGDEMRDRRDDRPMLQAPSPRRSLPLLQRRHIACAPYPLRLRAERMPTVMRPSRWQPRSSRRWCETVGCVRRSLTGAASRGSSEPVTVTGPVTKIRRLKSA